MNRHIEEMQNACKWYLNKRKEWARNRMVLEASFRPGSVLQADLDTADNANRKDYEDAIRRIAKAQASGAAAARAWGTPYGSEIEKDANLLSYGLGADVFWDLVDRHAKNGTMIAILREFGQKNMFHALPPTADELRAALWKKAEAASSIIQSINASITSAERSNITTSPLSDGSTPAIDVAIEALAAGSDAEMLDKYL